MILRARRAVATRANHRVAATEGRPSRALGRGQSADRLIQLQRRVQSRLWLPSITLDPAYLNDLLANAPILEFDHLAVDWGDFRFLCGRWRRPCAPQALEEADYRRAEVLSRDADKLLVVTRGCTTPCGRAPPVSTPKVDWTR